MLAKNPIKAIVIAFKRIAKVKLPLRFFGFVVFIEFKMRKEIGIYDVNISPPPAGNLMLDNLISEVLALKLDSIKLLPQPKCK